MKNGVNIINLKLIMELNVLQLKNYEILNKIKRIKKIIKIKIIKIKIIKIKIIKIKIIKIKIIKVNNQKIQIQIRQVKLMHLFQQINLLYSRETNK